MSDKKEEDKEKLTEHLKKTIKILNEGLEKREDVFSLSQGRIILSYPTLMNCEDFEDFKAWVENNR